MKTSISGPRDMTGNETLEIINKAVKDSGFKITELMSTGEAGVDTWAKNWANANNVPVTEFTADWNTIKGVPKADVAENKWGKKYNKKAAKQRDDMMMSECDAAIIIDDGGFSKKYLAEQYGVKLHVHATEDYKEYDHQF